MIPFFSLLQTHRREADLKKLKMMTVFMTLKTYLDNDI